MHCISSKAADSLAAQQIGRCRALGSQLCTLPLAELTRASL